MTENLAAQDYSYIKNIIKIFGSMDRKRHFQLVGLFILQSLSAVSQIISIGAIIPFLSALTDAKALFENETVGKVATYFEITDHSDLIFLATSSFALAIILANILRFATLWAQQSLSAKISNDLANLCVQKVLSKPYSYFTQNNSSMIIGTLTEDLNSTVGVIYGVCNLTSNILLTIAIIAGLLIYSPVITLYLAITILAAYLIITLMLRKRLVKNSYLKSDNYQRMIKILQESIGGIRHIILKNSYNTFISQYKKADYAFRISVEQNTLFKQAPRYLVEAIGIAALCLYMIYYLSYNGSIGNIIPMLGFLAMGSYRLLPAVQQVYSSTTAMMGVKASIIRTTSLLDAKRLDFAKYYTPLPIHERLSFENIYFTYSQEATHDTPWVLRDISLDIQANTTIALVGHTGSGKSTFADLALGLTQPNKGRILLDGQQLDQQNIKAWQASIAHVPQHIFLMDESIAHNIAFGVTPEEIDFDRVKHAAQLAQIDNFIEGLEHGYNTMIGERGIRLSGGQQQRIGIARALYQDPSMIVFDEATSALDNATEKEFMEAIEGLRHKLTMILIAHRLSTVKNADMIYVFDKGRIIDSGTYEDLMEHSEYFRHLVREAA